MYFVKNHSSGSNNILLQIYKIPMENDKLISIWPLLVVLLNVLNVLVAFDLPSCCSRTDNDDTCKALCPCGDARAAANETRVSF